MTVTGRRASQAAGSTTPAASSCATMTGWSGMPSRSSSRRACQPRSPGASTGCCGSNRLQVGEHRIDARVEGRAVAEGRNVDRQEQLRGARIEAARVALRNLRAKRTAGQRRRHQLHHDGEANPLVPAHRQQQTRLEDRRRVRGRVPLGVEAPVRRHRPAFAAMRGHLAKGRLRHRQVDDDRLLGAAPRNANCQRIVAQHGSRHARHRHRRDRVGRAEAEESGAGGTARVGMSAPPVRGVCRHAQADAVLPGLFNGSVHGRRGGMPARAVARVDHARRSVVAPHANHRVAHRAAVPQPRDQLRQHDHAVRRDAVKIGLHHQVRFDAARSPRARPPRGARRTPSWSALHERI